VKVNRRQVMAKAHLAKLKRTNNDLQNITHKTKGRVTRTLEKIFRNRPIIYQKQELPLAAMFVNESG